MVAKDELKKKRIEEMVIRNPEVARRATEVRAYTLQNFDKFIAKACETVQVKWAKVHVAKDSADAMDYITGVVQKQAVVRSGMPIAKEVNLDQGLTAGGASVTASSRDVYSSQERMLEFDLDELKRAVAQEKEKLMKSGVSGPKAITEAAQRVLKKVAGQTPVGITSADAIVAETGTIMFQENEGDLRIVSNLPPVHIVVVGLEKIVPTLEDGFAILRANAMYGSGQPIGNYISLISGPSRTGDIEFFIVPGMHGPIEVHVVLLDNGRSQAKGRGVQEILYCVECGRCLEHCPAYKKLGAKFGGSYPGGRGLVLEALSKNSLIPADLAEHCARCELCAGVCPVGIKTGKLIQSLAKGKDMVG